MSSSAARPPALSHQELKDFGFAIALYANAALQATILAVQTVLGRLKSEGSLANVPDLLATFTERQRVVAKPAFDALESRFLGS